MPDLKTRARKLRREQTAAEVKLWGALRKGSLQGHRFNRQHVIGTYIVDFLCRDKKFIIEVDGATHSDPQAKAYDAKRTAFLEAQGFEVFRVGNIDIYESLNIVLETISRALNGRKSYFTRKSPSGLRPAPPTS